MLRKVVPPLDIGKIAPALSGNHNLAAGTGHFFQDCNLCANTVIVQCRSGRVSRHKTRGASAYYYYVRLHIRLWTTKKGKLSTSHRYNLIPLLPSGPGGVLRELVVYDFPVANLRRIFEITILPAPVSVISVKPAVSKAEGALRCRSANTVFFKDLLDA